MSDPANDRLDQAIDVVARWLIAQAAAPSRVARGPFTLDDWVAIKDRVAFLAAELEPDDDAYHEAYCHLEQRAQDAA